MPAEPYAPFSAVPPSPLGVRGLGGPRASGFVSSLFFEAVDSKRGFFPVKRLRNEFFGRFQAVGKIGFVGAGRIRPAVEIVRENWLRSANFFMRFFRGARGRAPASLTFRALPPRFAALTARPTGNVRP